MNANLPLFEESQTDTAVHRDYLGIGGLSYCRNFLSRDEQTSLLHSIDQLPWRSDLARRVQHYGYKYDYKSRRIDESLRVGPLPDFAKEAGLRLINEKLIAEIPDQVIVNEYQPGQGISMHIDCEPCFRDTIVTISLGSVYIMDFHDTQSERIEEVALELGSALILSGEARYRWRHGIKSRKADHGRQRGRRVSLTFRNVILSDAESKPAKQKPTPKQGVVHSPNFADDFGISELLRISKTNLDAVDRSRVDSQHIVGWDNFAKLKVSTVFAAIAIESAINQFYLTHCLLVQTPYMQSFVTELTKKYLRAASLEKIDFLRQCWSEPFPDELINNVKRLLDIRNAVVHEKWLPVAENNSSHGIRELRNKELSREDFEHQERHYAIALDFLSRFSTPGNAELQQGTSQTEL